MKTYWALLKNGTWEMTVEKLDTAPMVADVTLFQLTPNKPESQAKVAEMNKDFQAWRDLESRANEDINESVEFFAQGIRDDWEKTKAGFSDKFQKSPRYAFEWHLTEVVRAQFREEQTRVLLAEDANVSRTILFKRVYSRIKGMVLAPRIPSSTNAVDNAMGLEDIKTAADLLHAMQAILYRIGRRDEARKALGLPPVDDEPVQEPIIY
jgi:hypothetical protein